VAGLGDYEDTGRNTGEAGHAAIVAGPGSQGGTVEEIPCRACQYKGHVTAAENRCETCDNLSLCAVCTGIHKKNKSTQDHVLIPIEKKGRDGTCKTHGEQLQRFCRTCSKACCHLCILFDHGDHVIETVGAMFHGLVAEVTSSKKRQEERSSELKCLGDDLKFMKSSTIDKQDALVSRVEDHAEKRIEQILQEKAALKEQIRKEFKITKELSACLEKVPTLTRRLDASVHKANQLLSDAEPHPLDIENLVSLRDEMTESGNIAVEIYCDDIDSYWESFEMLLQKQLMFVPNETDHNLGTLEVKLIKPTQRPVSDCKLIFEKELEVDDKAKFISCIVGLGNDCYAVARPTVKGRPADTVDIYKVPGDLQHTITEHVSPLYDMAATPGGKLAILSDGETAGTCSVRLFDVNTGYIRSIGDFSVGNPLSLGINLRSEYVLLSVSNDEGRKITIVNHDGLAVVSHTIEKTSPLRDASRITCSGKHIGVIGRGNVVGVYEQKGMKLIQVTTNRDHLDGRIILKDISASATAFKEITFCFTFSNVFYFGRYVILDNKLKNWSTKSIQPIKEDIEGRLSVCGDYIYSSHGHTIKVLKQ
jgi:uncharacterized protein (DUF2344 family)